MTTVYATHGGTRYHANDNCRALNSGQVLYGGWGDLRVHRIQETNPITALGEGKDPCTVCIPGLLTAIYRSNSENDYGHVPVIGFIDGRALTQVCARCAVVKRGPGCWWHASVRWPCTSAIVLGLAPRSQP